MQNSLADHPGAVARYCTSTAKESKESKTMEPNAIDEIARKLAQMLAPPPAGKNDIWDIGDIAQYLRYKKNTVYCKVLRHPTFPNPKILPTGAKRYRASEVKMWALRER